MPSQGENLTFFVRYQIGWMYLRYFMWNYSGRQNDVQGHGDFHRRELVDWCGLLGC